MHECFHHNESHMDEKTNINCKQLNSVVHGKDEVTLEKTSDGRDFHHHC